MWQNSFIKNDLPETSGELTGMNPDELVYAAYLVNTRYNQRSFDTGAKDRYTGELGVGLEYFIRRTMSVVDDSPRLIPNAAIRKSFLEQNPSQAARWLGSLAMAYIYLELNGVEVPGFVEFYLQAVERGLVVCPEGHAEFCLIRDDLALMQAFEPSCAYRGFKRSLLGGESRLIERFRKTHKKIALFRKGDRKRHNHTYLGVHCQDGQVRMLDAIHHHYTGRPVSERHPGPERLWGIFGYMWG